MASVGAAPSSPAPVPSSPPAAALRRFLKAREAELRRVVLHVNTQVVYSSEDSTSPFTLYVLKILDNSGASGRRGADDWQVEKRFSECYAFHSKFVKMVCEWEDAVAAEKHEQAEEGETARQRASVLLKALRRAAKREFPRKHMRYDTQSIVRERRERLPDFVHTLFTAYTDLMLYFQWYAGAFKGTQETAAHKQLRGIFSALESFLSVPAKRKEADARMVAAILALDAADQDPSAAISNDLGPKDGAMCCICLGDACDNYGGDESEADADAAEQWVTLPCDHQFHETCVISWFRSKASCPVCRRDPAAASARAMALH